MVSCGAGSQNATCTCNAPAQRFSGPQGLMCCGASNYEGWRLQRQCQAAGWTPTPEQQYEYDLWRRIAQVTAPPTHYYDPNLNLESLTCPGDYPHLVDVDVGAAGGGDRVCVKNYATVYTDVIDDPDVVFSKVQGCTYTATASTTAGPVTCGPYGTGSFSNGAIIPRPTSSGGGGNGGGGSGGGSGGGTGSGSGSTASEIWSIVLITLSIMAVLWFVLVLSSGGKTTPAAVASSPAAKEPPPYSASPAPAPAADVPQRSLYSSPSSFSPSF